MDRKHVAVIAAVSRALLAGLLVAGVWAAPPPPAALAAGGFTDLGGVGLPATDMGSACWGDYDSDGDLDALIAGGVYCNDGGSLVDGNAGCGWAGHRARATPCRPWPTRRRAGGGWPPWATPTTA